MPTNFDLAPPPKTVDGLFAVPIDIQHIDAHLSFDGSTQTASGDATLTFVVGPDAGCPIFDLRQTITAAWLDGASIPTSQLAHHDFGGGSGADLRVLAQSLAAGSSHTLRITYSLGPPQSPAGGSYAPALTWSSGPRLRCSFGFTDLAPARYLEAWVPANLIFDQYSVALEITITNTAIAHTVITNGAVTSLGTNHFSVAFPDRVTAFSTMVEVRASDTLAGRTDPVILSGSGSPVTVETWRLTTSTTDLAAASTALRGYLQTDATRYGAYLHGDRFVALFVGGGMEYDGGTTAGTGSLEHETHHSWFGRGVKPASQDDGWWDEGWTQYVTGGGTPVPLSSSDPPALLAPRNPWPRITQPNAYSDGERLFQGLAALIGDATLRSVMGSFYRAHSDRPATTVDLEAHLLAQTGRSEIVDLFHRFAYGLAGPAAAPDLWMRDEIGHTGDELWGARFWDSPDLWIRRSDDGGLVHQDPVAGRDNWLYARVRNRGPAAGHFMVTFGVKEFLGTQFAYPGDFLPCLAATGGFDLGTGGERIVKARWPASLVPAAGIHGCLLASVQSRSNHPVGGRHVWEENALAQKNLRIVAARAGAWVTVPLVVGHFQLAATSVLIEIRRPSWAPALGVSLLRRAVAGAPRQVAGKRRTAAARQRELALAAGGDGSLLDCGAPGSPDRIAESARAALVPGGFVGATEVPFKPGERALLRLDSRAGFPLLVGLRIQAPLDLGKRKGRTVIDVVQLDTKGRPVGGVAVELRLPAA